MIKNAGAAVLLAGGMALGCAAAVPAHASAAAPAEHAAGPAEYAAGLAEDLDAILRDDRLRGAAVGVVVRDAETGETLYGRRGGRRDRKSTRLNSSHVQIPYAG